mgnify:CR=1 FL=1
MPGKCTPLMKQPPDWNEVEVISQPQDWNEVSIKRISIDKGLALAHLLARIRLGNEFCFVGDHNPQD